MRSGRTYLALMDTSLATARILRFLEQEPVVWLSTVRPDGDPHLVPIWFWWDGEALLVFSKPNAQKVRNLRANPSVMLALGDAEDDFDIGLVEGRAELLDRPTEKVLPAAHLAKYADQLAAIGLTPTEYAATYSQVIRIVPQGFLGWHGRSTPHSARLAGAPQASIAEPRRDGFDPTDGEPMAVGRRARAGAADRPAGPRPAVRPAPGRGADRSRPARADRRVRPAPGPPGRFALAHPQRPRRISRALIGGDSRHLLTWELLVSDCHPAARHPPAAQVADDLARGVLAVLAGHATARVRPGTRQVEPVEPEPVASVAEQRSPQEELVEAVLAVHRMAAGQSDSRARGRPG